MEQELFKKYIPMESSLLEYGFQKEEDFYQYRTNLDDLAFSITIIVSLSGNVKVQVWDQEWNDEYFGFRQEHAGGEFSGTVRNKVENLLMDIRSHCFMMRPFIGNQANRITKLLFEKYQDVPSFEWEDYPGFGVFKNQESKKWYAIIMNIDRSKLNAGTGEFEIVNVKIEDKKIPDLVLKEGIYPAYHMNKKYWISIALDDSLEDEEIMKYIEESYQYTILNSPKKSKGEWIIPANPKYYDVEANFTEGSIQSWKQSSNIQAGDIIYIYIGAPVSSIRFQCLVLKTDIPFSYKDSNVQMKKLIEVKVLKKYERGICTFQTLKKYGVNAVRGPRYMPKELSEFLSKQ